jgi:hypothetical protein
MVWVDSYGGGGGGGSGYYRENSHHTGFPVTQGESLTIAGLESVSLGTNVFYVVVNHSSPETS